MESVFFVVSCAVGFFEGYLLQTTPLAWLTGITLAGALWGAHHASFKSTAQDTIIIATFNVIVAWGTWFFVSGASQVAQRYLSEYIFRPY